MIRRGRSSQGMSVVMLLMQISRIGVRNLGPITIGVLAVNLFIHFGLSGPAHIRDLCVFGPSIIDGFDLKRVITAAFVHADDMHLAYNMTSFIWKAHLLEPLLGPTRFIVFILYAALMSNVLLVGLSYGMGHLLGYWSTYRTCTVGFSAVLFALKVVVTQHSGVSPQAYVMGVFSVPSKHIYWVELLLISLLVPRASFAGHLCGILAGLFYTSGFLEPLFHAIDIAVPPSRTTAGGGAGPLSPPSSLSYLSGGRVYRGEPLEADDHSHVRRPAVELSNEERRRAMREIRELQQAQLNSVHYRRGR